MKRIAIILALAVALPLAMLSQDKEMTKLFNQYKNVKGFELKDVDPNINVETEDEYNIVSFLDKVEKIYILSFDDSTGNKADLTAFTEKLNKLLDKKSFESMFDIGGDSRVEILLRKGKDDKLTDFFLTTIGDEDATFVWAVAP